MSPPAEPGYPRRARPVDAFALTAREVSLSTCNRPKKVCEFEAFALSCFRAFALSKFRESYRRAYSQASSGRLDRARRRLSAHAVRLLFCTKCIARASRRDTPARRRSRCHGDALEEHCRGCVACVEHGHNARLLNAALPMRELPLVPNAVARVGLGGYASRRHHRATEGAAKAIGALKKMPKGGKGGKRFPRFPFNR